MATTRLEELEKAVSTANPLQCVSLAVLKECLAEIRRLREKEQ